MMRVLFLLGLHLAIGQNVPDLVQIPNVNMAPEGKFLRIVINETKKESGAFLFSQNGTVVLHVKISRPIGVGNAWTRNVELASAKDNTTTAKGQLATWIPGVTCKGIPIDSIDFEFFAFYNSQSGKVCGKGIQPGCSMKREGELAKYNFGPEMVSHITITTSQVVAVTACVNNTELCPV